MGRRPGHGADAEGRSTADVRPREEPIEARAMFGRRRSLDEIVDRAYQLLFVSVEMHLAAQLRKVA